MLKRFAPSHTHLHVFEIFFLRQRTHILAIVHGIGQLSRGIAQRFVGGFPMRPVKWHDEAVTYLWVAPIEGVP